MKTYQQFISEAANQISPITGKGYLVIPPVNVKDTKGMKRHIVPDYGNPNYKPPQTPQASSSKKNDKVAQLPEAATKSDKLTGRLKMLYNLPKDSDKYFKQQNPQVDRLKKAQLAPLEKENQLPGKYSDVFIRTVDSSMDKLKNRVKRYGNLQRLKDIDPRYP